MCCVNIFAHKTNCWRNWQPLKQVTGYWSIDYRSLCVHTVCMLICFHFLRASRRMAVRELELKAVAREFVSTFSFISTKYICINSSNRLLAIFICFSCFRCNLPVLNSPSIPSLLSVPEISLVVFRLLAAVYLILPFSLKLPCFSHFLSMVILISLLVQHFDFFFCYCSFFFNLFMELARAHWPIRG